MKTRLIAIVLMISSQVTLGQSLVGTVHNLSVSGPGSVKAASDQEICIFCHTPHTGSPEIPLWNRPEGGSFYTLYSSSTVQANPGQPTGSSILCLSCHDGTVALGNVLSRPQPISFTGGVTTMPAGTTNLSTDLSDDHPISFVYSLALALADGELVDPAGLAGPVRLESGKVECSSCHDAHQNLLGDFLVARTQNSQLCLYCHDRVGWDATNHANSPATWNGSGTNPWPHTEHTTVAANACENCHSPHGAGGYVRLTHYLTEETNCLVCHNGNVAAKDLEATLTRPYTHNVALYQGIHDATEPSTALTRHVECADCHNPHASNAATAVAPNAQGEITGVQGVDSNGLEIDPIQYQYELCYRCHADSPDKTGSATIRLIEQSNTRLEFDLANPSHHAVEGPGQNSNVPSLNSPLTESSVIYCTDCHASSGAGADAGPHGSIYPSLLKYNYETADYTPESYQSYELCYQCHDRLSVIQNGPGKFGSDVHNEHIVGEDTPCNVCHDPHGISSTQGNTTNNRHLINFNTAVVSPNQHGLLKFEDRGSYKGRCYLKCHGKNHMPKSY